MRYLVPMLVVSILLASACGAWCPGSGEDAMDPIAEAYVRLVLAVGEHDEDYVDAYYGPATWRETVRRDAPGLDAIRAEAGTLIARIDAVAIDPADAMRGLRRDYLATQLRALAARVELLGGARLGFDEESRALYDAVSPRHDDAHYEAILAELDPLLPGAGPLVERYATFRSAFIIPPEQVAPVFRAAVAACRERTAQHLELPAEESFEIEYVTDKPWSGYNWYQGGFHSLIQVNTDLPIYIDRAIDLACHEGYPGHHAYNVLLERHLVRDRGWVEFSVYPLFSPQSLIAEGTANFGIEVAFPGAARVAFERERLFPLAGLDPATTERYYAVQRRLEGLAYAGNDAARAYLDGAADAEQTVQRLMRYALMPRDRAEQRLRFIERYRSYVINYNLGQDLVRAHVEALGGTADQPERRWEVFAELLSSPRLPSGLAGR